MAANPMDEMCLVIGIFFFLIMAFVIYIQYHAWKIGQAKRKADEAMTLWAQSQTMVNQRAMQAPAPVAPQAIPTPNTAQRLEAAKRLYDQGTISKEEYDRKREELIKQL